MIDIKNLSFSVEKKRILSDVNASFNKGKICAIIGPNGSGKTTLIRLIGRLAEPDSGNISVEGKNLSEYRRKELARKIALLPQGRPVPNISVSSLVSHGRFPYLDLSRKLTADDRKITERAMEITDTLPLMHRNVSELSGGERQRVYLAMLLAQDTPCVLLDEPTTYLDISHQFAVMEILRYMRSEGKCVAVVLHDLALALKYCDQILLMSEGKPCFFGTPQETVASGSIEQIFGISCLKVKINGETEYIFKPKI